MPLMGPTQTPPRWDRARTVVEDHLRHEHAGMSTIALVDRLVLWGFPEDEAMAILRRLQEQAHVQLVAGRWVLAES